MLVRGIGRSNVALVGGGESMNSNREGLANTFDLIDSHQRRRMQHVVLVMNWSELWQTQARSTISARGGDRQRQGSTVCAAVAFGTLSSAHAE